MEIEVDQGRGDVLDRAESFVEVARRDQPLQQFLRHRFAGAVMPREAAQHVGLFEPVLVELRGQFDEVGGDVGAGDFRIGDGREQAVQRMAELVKQRARILEAQKGRLAVGALGEIHHVDDQRLDVAVEFLLIAQRGHPGAAALRGPGEIIAEEQADLVAAGAAHLPDPDVGMPHRQLGAHGKAQAEQTLRGIERGLDHAVEVEIGLDRGLVEIAAPLPQFFGVIAPVPWRQLEVAAVFLHQFLHGVAVGERARARRLPHGFEEVARGFRRLRHRVLEPVMGEVGVAQKPRPLGAQLDRLGDDCLVVGCSAIVAARDEGAEDFFAQVAALRELQEGFRA